MNYKETITQVMTALGKRPDVLFLGQSVRYSGNVMFNTLEGVPMDKRIEMPVAEEMQMGISIGLSLQGYLPISLYPRMDFLILAMNQLVNHLDKIEEMSCGQFKPKVIIRTMIGSRTPFEPGVQHRQDHIQTLRMALHHIPVKTIHKDALPTSIINNYVIRDSCVIVEYGDGYSD